MRDDTMTQEQQPESINEIQRLYFELFRRVNYNLLDGARVVSDLFTIISLFSLTSQS
jgi:hypothetical protein